jgi:hypothetical protein
VHQQQIEGAVPLAPDEALALQQHPDDHPSDRDGRTGLDRAAGVGRGGNPDTKTALDAPAEEEADHDGRRGEAGLPDAQAAEC